MTVAIVGKRAEQREKVREIMQWMEHTSRNFCANTSTLFKNRMIDVRMNHLELMTFSNKTSDSAIRFYSGMNQYPSV